MEMEHKYSKVYVVFGNCVNMSSCQKRQARKGPKNDVCFLSARTDKLTESGKFNIHRRKRIHGPRFITFSITTSIMCTAA